TLSPVAPPLKTRGGGRSGDAGPRAKSQTSAPAAAIAARAAVIREADMPSYFTRERRWLILSAVTAPAGAPESAARDGAAPLVLPLAELREEHLPLVGAKALSLGTMRRAGFPVPDGFCLTTEAMRAFIRESEGLGARLDEIAAHATKGGLSLKESWAFLGETRKLICAAAMPKAVRKAVRDAYARLARKPDEDSGTVAVAADEPVVAVRASGAREDLGGA